MIFTPNSKEMAILLTAGCLVFLAAAQDSGDKAKEDTRQNPKNGTTTAKPKVASKPAPKQQKSANGTVDCEKDLSNAIDKCSRPLMDIIEGRLESWPANEKDAIDLCNSFAGAEKCIKEVTRKCAKGIQKTIYSTFANSVQRARKQECTKEKYPNILKLTKCVERYQEPMHVMISNIMNRLTMIKDQISDPSKRINALCCMINNSEQDIKQLLHPKCPSEAATIVRLYRAVLEDVNELICRNAKCDDVFKGLKPVNRKYSLRDQGFGMVKVIMTILDSLS